ncbi:MAG: amidohydrolase family protein [Hyphomicrobiales bacterium]
MTTTRTIEVEATLVGSDYKTSGPVAITISDGCISEIETLQDKPFGPRRFAMPALADAHNHARPLSTTSFGAGFKPLETWLPSLAAMPAVDPYLAALASFGRSALGGCTSVMVHLTRPMGRNGIVSEAKDIARAAKDVGVKIGFALSMRDQNPLTYRDHENILSNLSAQEQEFVTSTWLQPMPSVEQQLLNINDIAKALENESHVDVQYGPAGVQWCSKDLLRKIADASARTGRRIHMHMLETLPQRVWADESFPGGVLPYLDSLGILSDRLTFAHCVWARSDELRLLGSKSATISVNPSSNLHLASGIANAAEMAKSGVKIAMGLDGCAFDEDDDALREMRLFRLLNQGWAFSEGLSPQQTLQAVCKTGRQSLGIQQGGTIEVGMPADLLLLDLDALDRDAVMAIDPIQFLFTRANNDSIVEVISDGETIVLDGALATLDLGAIQAELRNTYRENMAQSKEFFDNWSRLEPLLNEHYQCYAGCC